MEKITVANYAEGRERMSRGETGVPTYYYTLARGDRQQLIRQGNTRYTVSRISGLCMTNGHLAGNVYTTNGYYYTVPLR